MITAEVARTTSEQYREEHHLVDQDKLQIAFDKKEEKRIKLISKLLIVADKAIMKAIRRGLNHAYFGLWWNEDKRYLCAKALRELKYDVDTNMYCRVRVDW